jgi:NAD(P)H-dependent FMN reductase
MLCVGAATRRLSSTQPSSACRCSTACTRNTSAAPRRRFSNVWQLYRKVDAFAIVSGEYNNGIPPALKNLLDHFLEEYFFRPSAIVCYSAGQFGGVRAAMQLRMTLAELGMPSIPSLLPIPRVQDAFTPAGEPTDPAFEKRSERFFREFEWYAGALRRARAEGVPY